METLSLGHHRRELGHYGKSIELGSPGSTPGPLLSAVACKLTTNKLLLLPLFPLSIPLKVLWLLKSIVSLSFPLSLGMSLVTILQFSRASHVPGMSSSCTPSRIAVKPTPAAGEGTVCLHSRAGRCGKAFLDRPHYFPRVSECQRQAPEILSHQPSLRLLVLLSL